MGGLQSRNWVNGGVEGDAFKVVEKIYHLASLESPPLHLPLGKDAVERVKEKNQALSTVLERYESWSDDLLADD